MSTEELKKVVEQAEAAVVSVKDAGLRKAAFEKILEKLLGGGTPAHHTKASRSPTASNGRPARKVRGGPQAHIEELIEEGFFKKPRQFKPIMGELEAKGHHLPRTTVSPTLLQLCRAKRLRRRKVDGSWEYSNW